MSKHTNVKMKESNSTMRHMIKKLKASGGGGGGVKANEKSNANGDDSDTIK